MSFSIDVLTWAAAFFFFDLTLDRSFTIFIPKSCTFLQLCVAIAVCQRAPCSPIPRSFQKIKISDLQSEYFLNQRHAIVLMTIHELFYAREQCELAHSWNSAESSSNGHAVLVGCGHSQDLDLVRYAPS